jgi:hypothetical protein
VSTVVKTFIEISRPAPSNPWNQTELGGVDQSAGVADAGKLVLLGPGGLLDPTLIGSVSGTFDLDDGTFLSPTSSFTVDDGVF